MVRTSHIVFALILHVVVLGMLFVGFRCSKKVTPPPVIQATIVGTPAPAKHEPPKEDPRKLEEQKRKTELEKQKIEEKKKTEQQAKLKTQEEAKKKAADDLKKKKDETEHKAREDQAKHDAEKKKQEQKELENQLDQQIKQEEGQRSSAARATAEQIWVAEIMEKIKRNWLQPPGAPDDFKCPVHVQLLPGGQVVGVTLIGSCGNSILEDSVKRAVLKSDPLPVPQDPSVFQREINFNFIP